MNHLSRLFACMHASLPKITKTFLKRGIVKSLIEPRGELGADLKMTQRRVSSTEMNFAAKVLLVVFVVLISYLISILLLISLFPTRPWSMHEMMDEMHEEDSSTMHNETEEFHRHHRGCQ